MIRWFAENGIAANFLMVAILVTGAYTAAYHIPLEVSPAFSWNTVMITMPYRGATAKDVERAILIPVEEALEGVEGIEQLNADGSRGMARFYLTAKPGTDLRVLMEEVKARVDTIDTFPSETEQPRIYIPTSESMVTPGISQVSVRGAERYEISIEAKLDRLLAYGLTFQDLATSIRAYSIDLPAGAIDSDSGTFVVRTRGQAFTREEFAKIPIRSADGSEVSLDEVATIHDGFTEDHPRLMFNGKPALLVPVMRVGDENALEISDKVNEYVRTAHTRFPEGVELKVFGDESRAIRNG